MAAWTPGRRCAAAPAVRCVRGACEAAGRWPQGASTVLAQAALPGAASTGHCHQQVELLSKNEGVEGAAAAAVAQGSAGCGRRAAGGSCVSGLSQEADAEGSGTACAARPVGAGSPQPGLCGRLRPWASLGSHGSNTDCDGTRGSLAQEVDPMLCTRQPPWEGKWGVTGGRWRLCPCGRTLQRKTSSRPLSTGSLRGLSISGAWCPT